MQGPVHSDVSCPILDQFCTENTGRKSVTVGLIFEAFWGHKCLRVINLQQTWAPITHHALESPSIYIV